MATRGLAPPPPDPWTLDQELRQHIQHCPCACNHMGYGNYLDYQVPVPSRGLHVRETSFGALPHHYSGIRDSSYEYDYHSPSFDSCSCSSDSESARTIPRGPWCICLVVCIVIATIAAGLSFPLALNSHFEPQTPEERLDAVYRLLKKDPLIDGHNDFPWNLRKFVHNKLIGLNLTALHKEEPWSKSRWSHTDISRLRKGLLGAQFWSAYVPCKSQHLDAVQITLEQIDVIKRLVEFNSQHFSMVSTSSEIRNVHRQGKIASLIGVEGGHSLGNSLAVLRTFYNLGARYLTITHSCDTSWAKGGNSDEGFRFEEKSDIHEGLTAFGKSVIKEMNRLGMIIDLSHTSTDTAKAALNVSKAPIIFSHSSAFSLCNSPRNVPDDVLELVALNGGVVMVNFYTYHVNCNESATLQDVIKHINHVRRIAGVEHVGIGAGYDGINMTPTGLEDVSRYPHLLAELLADPKWTEKDIALLAGLNLLRVFGKVEDVRDEFKLAQVLPEEDIGPWRPSRCSSIYS